MLLVWPDHASDDAPATAAVAASKPAAPVVGAPAHEGCASCVATDGTVVATGGFDGIVRVWALEPPIDAADGDGAVPHLRLVHRVRVRVLCTERRAPDGVTDRPMPQLLAHAGDVYALCLRGTTLVSGGLDAKVRVWDTETGRCVQTLTGHKVRRCGWLA